MAVSPYRSVTELRESKALIFPELSCEPKIEMGGRGGHSTRGWLYNEIMVIVLLIAFLLCCHGRRFSE